MEELRNKIDQIDNKILKLLEQRFKICKKIGDYKKQNNLPIQYLQREKEIITTKTNMTNLNKTFIKELFELIFKESKKIQNIP